MGYLISKIIICLFLAFLLGLVIGWLLRNQITRNREDVLIADVEGQMETIEKLERERVDIRRKLQNMERANVDLNSKILSITSEGDPMFYTQDPLTTDFNSLSDSRPLLDSKGNTLNESDDFILNSDHKDPSTEETSTGSGNDHATQEIEEVLGEWDPLTAELDQLSVSLSGADLEVKTLTSENDLMGEEQTQPTQKKGSGSEAQSQPTPDSTTPRESNQSEQKNNLFDEKSYRLNTADDESDDRLKPDSIKADTQATAADYISKPQQNPSTAGLFDSNPLNEDTLVLETTQTGSSDDILARSGDYDIEEIEGIGKGYAERLQKLKIATTLQLLDKASNPAIITQIAHQVNKKEKLVQSWVSMADLIRVPGIRGKFAELIAATGVKSVQQLAMQEGSKLTKKMADINARENRNRTTPSIDMVTVWIAAAKSLPSIINTESW
jgi:hypothetical protein